jgi:hypothetical protein
VCPRQWAQFLVVAVAEDQRAVHVQDDATHSAELLEGKLARFRH